VAGVSRRVAWAAALALSACAAVPEPAEAPASAAAPPLAVILYEHTLTVTTADKALCVGLRGREGRRWQGQLEGCPHGWPYRAELPPGRVARLPLVAEGEGQGRVEIDAPGGTLVYAGGR